MFLSSPVLKETALARGRTVFPKVTVFSEVLPLASKNVSTSNKGKVAASSCTQELQALFGCLKKWEFDDKPCSKQHSSYMDCIHESQRITEEYNRAAREGKIGEGQGNSMTTAQFNKLMKLFPQPDLGQTPYRQMKRLPTQSYSCDIYNRKGWKGKAS